MALHSALANAELHENKGVSAATDNTVASATSAATVWRKVNANMIDTAAIFNTNKEILWAVIDDVSTAATIYIVLPYACTVTKVDTALGNAITVADAVLTCSNHAGASMGTITVAYTGSAAGDLDTLSPAGNNTFTAGQRMAIATDGGSTTLSKLYITVSLTRTA